MENYFIKNLETGKLNLFTSKEFYTQLDEHDKKDIKRFCLFSRTIGGWVSKAIFERTTYLRQKLISLGFEYKGTQGEKIPFAEKIERKQERAEQRAERYLQFSQNAEKRSLSLYNESQKMASFIPFGQPILVGHHSEKRDRAFRNKISQKMDNSIMEADKASYFRDRAATAKQTAEGKKYNDPGYLQRRIADVEADIRQLQRFREGKIYHYSEPKEISEERKALYDQQISEKEEERQFYLYCIETCGVVVWNRETLKDKTEVLIRGRWQGIAKLNPKKIAVVSTLYPTEELNRKYGLSYQYGEVKDAR